MSNPLKALLACLLTLACGSAMASDIAEKTFDTRSREIVAALEASSPQLDSTYNFEPFAQSGWLAPVLVETTARADFEPPCSLAACVIKTLARPYCKASHDSSQCVPVTWRDYLFKGLADKDPSLSARDADARFKTNLAEMQIDRRGMTLYTALAAKGLVSLPITERK